MPSIPRTPAWQAAGVLAALLLVCGGLAVGNEEDGGSGGGASPKTPAIRPFEGLLPVPDRARNVSPGGGLDPAVDFVAVRIVEGTTGEGLAGARLRWFEEDVSGFRLRYAPLLAEAKADAHGFAWVPLPDGLRPGHWIADAPGHAPEQVYGIPTAVMALGRGIEASARLLDGRGRPLGGVEVEWWLGCPHGPALGRTRTGTDGVFTFRDLNPEGDVWFFAPPSSLASLDYEVGDLLALGTRRADVVLPAGVTIRGRVVDPDGKERAGVVGRADDGTRGPAVATGADGTFVLAGVEAGASLFLFDPLRPGAEPVGVEGATEGAPLRLVLGPEGLVDEDLPLATLSVRVQDDEGRPLEGLRLLLVGERGLPVREAVTGADGDPAVFEVPEGSHALLSDATPFGPWGVGPRDVEIPAGGGGATEMALVGRRRLPLVVEGSSWGVLACRGHEWPLGDTDGPPFLDADAEAAVRWGSVVVRVGPPEDGVRRARYVRPAHHTIRVEGMDLDEAAHLFLPGRGETTWLDGEVVAGVFETRAAGPVVLATGISGDGGDLTFPLDLPSDRWVDLVLDPSDLPPAPPQQPARLFFEAPAGHGVEHANLEAGSYTVFGVESGVEIEVPCHVRLDVPGLVILEADLREGGDHRLTWGPGVLRLEVRDPDGRPAEAVVWLDGHLYRTQGGRLDLAGLEPGEREVIVSPTTCRLRGVVLSSEVAAEGPIEAEVRFTHR